MGQQPYQTHGLQLQSKNVYAEQRWKCVALILLIIIEVKKYINRHADKIIKLHSIGHYT